MVLFVVDVLRIYHFSFVWLEKREKPRCLVFIVEAAAVGCVSHKGCNVLGIHALLQPCAVLA